MGHANFHHWIKDQSKAVVVQNAAGQETDVLRKGLSLTHAFEVNGRKMYWRSTSGESKASKIFRPHLECVDDDGVVLAFYNQQHRCFRPGAVEKTMGELEIKKDGLEVEEVETMMMTLTVVWIKTGRRVMQGSQAGVAGGLVTALAYTIGG